MFEIILISHGPLSKAMLETAQMIVGEQEHVTCFGLYLGDSVDLFRERVEEEIRNKLEESDVLVLTDMQSGSPFNVTVGAMGYFADGAARSIRPITESWELRRTKAWIRM
ncbi:PTS sugar transporter subunit IIA [Laedolimicola sp.]|uniref:PTS sugar transporter subunit IIA n=1 Tax=Laedolimicola sp. TaxID=2981663 RepID=UPI003F7DA9E6